MNNLEYEKRIIGAVKMENTIFEELNIETVDFYDKRNQIIWDIIKKLSDVNTPINDLTIWEFAKKHKLEFDLPYCAEIRIETTANINFYLTEVKEMSKKRKILNMITDIQENIESRDFVTIVDKIEKQLTDITSNNFGQIDGISDVIKKTIDLIEESYKNDAMSGISTGFQRLDHYTDGFQRQELVIIAARPSKGKTALALDIMMRMAHNKVKCGFFSAEMSAGLLGKRILSSDTRINLSRVKNGCLTDGNFKVLMESANKIYNMGIWIDDTPNIPLSTLKNRARQLKRKGCQIIFIDYLTLIKFVDKKMSRPERVGHISKELKHLARELDIPVVTMSQLSREAEDKTPTLAHLRQSGEIEEDADVIIFLGDKESFKLIIAKNRNGPTGIVNLNFIKEINKFEEA